MKTVTFQEEVTMIKGKLTPIKKNVIVEEMNFGEQKTKAGLII